ncbi:homoserine dehydrogenase [Nannocystis exedens]|uniref:Homoserine dehydrogenase n=1 Tax=Nannocystis exedens TaxID=54 RepID=A0A1I2DC87_9BACT|nr:homoserine dehydrogenase [Nannocystis exedens]PCC70621.1 homoserine dehydrogenase [Nannocystis exedens]SFE77580.1 homoserine dehydrogenase [Nannocystis exedens]
MRALGVGILGLGNVGAGTVRLLGEHRARIEARLGASLTIRRVLVRDRARERAVDVAPELLTTDIGAVLGDPEIAIVVELMGGVEPARSYILAALRAGKHVVTANKAVLAERGAEIFAEAARVGRAVVFEGSVAGGIPLLRSLREGLASDRITGLCGIVNGTSNYILDAMTRTGAGFADALAGAQAAGYAEADPTLDVGGGDAAHKLALLALVAFGVQVDPATIPTEGISHITAFDIRAAAELGFVIKSLAIGQRDEHGVSLRVHPTLVPRTHVLAGVQGAFNAVLVQSDALGPSLYYGRGAGMMPTAVAVVSDILEVARDLLAGLYSGPGRSGQVLSATSAPVRLRPLADVVCAHYLCFRAPHVPGVLGRVAACLGRHGVSIRRMSQETPSDDGSAAMVMLTEPVADGPLAAALVEAALPVTRLRLLPGD